ncbi:MAG: peptide chain release factor N(5)-glutamine methyltransferase [Rhodoferax sp.]|uniref:peptide chain release factor N(5)-glutamine methyltransferase n=1 Tax=Rhodoferax sp. TaxID=50421 RepID=UPI00260EF7FE|nr:peptide chain release factor N(5)-glutamine methyltransferase [Rhodoferax sp.]MDD5332167.1 peptide chain release factor N(5)-glutamine methyltransferase [Rhodoferax sp.]
MATLAQALLQAQSLGLDRLDAQLLLLHALGKRATRRAWLLAHDTDELPANAQACFDAFVQRRADNEPLAYLTGHKEFFGLDLRVDGRVLVPRPDTETLVEWALEVLAQTTAGSDPVAVLDLGTGSGAIALALKATRPALAVSATDASADALAVARANAQRLNLEVQFAQGSWLDGVTGRYHAIVSNPPYVAAQDRHLEALRHEPQQALTSGVDGLDDLRHIINQAPTHLHAAGWLLLEHGHDQAEAVRELLRQVGFVNVQSRRDLSGIERCSGGQYRY